MRKMLILFLLALGVAHADTIDRYMNIVNSLPKMEMKADQQAQAWARAARNVIALTGESIAETLILANETGKKEGKPLYCPPPDYQLNATVLNQLIQQTYREISSQESDKGKMTVSEVALAGLQKQYPCQPKVPMMQGESSTL